LRYGINVCCSNKSIDELEVEKEICDWKKLTGRDLLSEVQMRRFTNKPIYIGGEIDETYYVGRTLDGVGFNYKYDFDAEQNIIEVNVGGSITRINVNPVINIDRSQTGGTFAFEQLIPSSVWNIVHNLGFIPGNELITDLNGAEIDGVTEVVNINVIRILFSEPVAGYAYLS
jgi:hypothetical protein